MPSPGPAHPCIARLELERKPCRPIRPRTASRRPPRLSLPPGEPCRPLRRTSPRASHPSMTPGTARLKQSPGSIRPAGPPRRAGQQGPGGRSVPARRRSWSRSRRGRRGRRTVRHAGAVDPAPHDEPLVHQDGPQVRSRDGNGAAGNDDADARAALAHEVRGAAGGAEHPLEHRGPAPRTALEEQAGGAAGILGGLCGVRSRYVPGHARVEHDVRSLRSSGPRYADSADGVKLGHSDPRTKDALPPDGDGRFAGPAATSPLQLGVLV